MELGEVRLRNLLALLREHGKTQIEFARDMDTNPAYVSQIIHRHAGRRMGSHFARRVEQLFELERGWMDRDHSRQDGLADTGMHRTLSDTAYAVGRMIDGLDERTRTHVQALIRGLSTAGGKKKKG